MGKNYTLREKPNDALFPSCVLRFISNKANMLLSLVFSYNLSFNCELGRKQSIRLKILPEPQHQLPWAF